MTQYFLPIVLALASISASHAKENEKTLDGKPVKKARCEQDNLNKSQARQRLAWLNRCIQKFSQNNKGSFYGITMYQTYRMSMKHHKKTDQAIPRERPIYPMFYNSETNEVYRPYPTGSKDKDDCDIPDGYVVAKYCTSSCYTPDQRVWYSEGEVPIGDAYNELLQDIMVVSEDSTARDIQYRRAQVQDYVRSAIDGNHDILVIQTESGAKLKVTPNHPLVNQTGQMVEAGDLTSEDSLVNSEGVLERITSIEETAYHGKVYNVSPEIKPSQNGIDLNGQIVVAQGFLSGSNWYQNEGHEFLNRSLLRSNIPEKILTQ